MIYSVVVTYNGRKWLDKCIQSLANSNVSNNIIIVDNGSSDGTPEIIRKNYPDVEVIEPGHNLGFGKANNIGLKKAYEAGADFVFLINQDAWVEKDTIEKLVKAAKCNKEYGILSPVHLTGEGYALDYGFFNCILAGKAKGFLSDLYLKPKEEIAEIYQLDFINGAFWFLPRKTIETVGGFNPFFFQYGEDNDYVNRCRFFELKIGFVPHAKAYHDRVQHDSDKKRDLMLHIPFLIRLFDPGDSFAVNTCIRILVKATFTNLLTIKLAQAQNSATELMYFISNKNKILELTDQIRSPGLTFLD